MALTGFQAGPRGGRVMPRSPRDQPSQAGLTCDDAGGNFHFVVQEGGRQEEGHSVSSDQPSRFTSNPGRRTGVCSGVEEAPWQSLLLHAGPQPQLLPLLGLGLLASGQV